MRPFLELIPMIIGGILKIIGTDLGLALKFIKINAVGPGVAKDTV